MRKFLSLLLALVMVLCCIPAVAETADGVYEGTGAGLNGQIKVSVTVSGRSEGLGAFRDGGHLRSCD